MLESSNFNIGGASRRQLLFELSNSDITLKNKNEHIEDDIESDEHIKHNLN